MRAIVVVFDHLATLDKLNGLDVPLKKVGLRAKVARLQNLPVAEAERLVDGHRGGDAFRPVFVLFVSMLFVVLHFVVELHRERFWVQLAAVHDLTHRL